MSRSRIAVCHARGSRIAVCHARGSRCVTLEDRGSRSRTIIYKRPKFCPVRRSINAVGLETTAHMRPDVFYTYNHAGEVEAALIIEIDSKELESTCRKLAYALMEQALRLHNIGGCWLLLPFLQKTYFSRQGYSHME